MVLRENAPSPVFSDLPAEHRRTSCEAIPGVRVVAPEVWKVAPNIEGQAMFAGLIAGQGGAVDPRPARDPGAGHRRPPAPQERRLSPGHQGEGRGAVPDPRATGPAAHRHQPEDRQATTPTPDGKPQQGRRHAPDRRQAVQDRRPVRDRVDAPGRGDRHGHRDGAEAAGVCPKTRSRASTSRRRPGAERRSRARRSSRRLPEDVDARSMTEFMANFGRADGPDRQVPADDRQPRAAGRASSGSSTRC